MIKVFLNIKKHSSKELRFISYSGNFYIPNCVAKRSGKIPKTKSAAIMKTATIL